MTSKELIVLSFYVNTLNTESLCVFMVCKVTEVDENVSRLSRQSS